MTGISFIDFFCGAGGSSTGIRAAGAQVVHAANHWKRAIETHELNHPNTAHSIDDLQQAHASWYPRTDCAWFSPECKNHSTAKGRKRKGIDQMTLPGFMDSHYDPAEERSRATMREVVEFSSFHKYKVVIVENVVEITHWTYYDAWLKAMTDLGYEHKVLYLNAQFFGVPQSRDRIYVVFWQRGIRAPNLDFRPAATCAACGDVLAMQVFKPNSKTLAKRYGANRQYIYRCPHCYAEVRPWHVPAAVAIDWALPVERIADRKKPLKPKTMERIHAGLKKLAARSFVVDTANSHAGHNGKVKSTDEPMPTQTARASQALALPMLWNMKFSQQPKGVDQPFQSITSINSNCLVTPPFTLAVRGTATARSVDEPMLTITANDNNKLIVPPSVIVTNRENNVPRTPDEPLSAVLTGNHHMLVTLRNNTLPRGVDEALTSIEAGGTHHGLIVSLNHSGERSRSVDDPMATVMPHVQPWLLTLRQSMQAHGVDEALSTVSAGGNNHALIYNYRRGEPFTGIDEALNTVTAHAEQHALATPPYEVEDCGFRMLEPEELKRAMGFPLDYTILGNKRERVRQVGNAVCCPVAYAIVSRVIEALEKSA